uniref:Cytochrome c oxidase subunit 3 n=1 Tax=Clinostomum complanatum TaxID=235145 RepID=A0A0F6PKF5_CLICO|nr:cytochrome c oxidase subunit III [Clinostomum complanatum]AJR27996.1 cytochrome c oxidase subunit III [Clinostomum complanatum]
MSWLSLYNAWVICVAIVSLFLWKLVGVAVFVILLILPLIYLIKEVLGVEEHHLSGFWLFILTEVAAFFTLFVTCLWFEGDGSEPISSFIELPFLGCFVLIGSSALITTYHHYLGLSAARWFLFLGVALGSCFLVIQVLEFYDCGFNLFSSVYAAVSFCTVGLHFLHVVIGLVILSILLMLGELVMDRYYADLCVWYWHFVDYIWLLVYMVVYLS